MANEDHFSLVRIGIFVIGVVLIVLAMLLLLPDVVADPALQIFISIDAVILYEIVFGPLLVSESIAKLTAGRIVSIGVFYRGIIPYALASLGIMIRALSTNGSSLRALIVLQLSALFVLLVMLYLGSFTGVHVDQVERDENVKMSSINALRAESDQLMVDAKLLAESRDTETQTLVDMISEICEAVRYLTPVQSKESIALEKRIESCIGTLSIRLQTYDDGYGQVEEANKIASETLALIRRRNKLRN